MDLEQLKRILDLVREHELAEFEIEHEGLRLKVRKHSAGTTVTSPRPSRATMAFETSLLTMTAGRRLLASDPRLGSKSTK